MTDNNRRARKRACRQTRGTDNAQQQALGCTPHCAGRPGGAEEQTAEEKEITEQLKLINAALAECFHSQGLLVQCHPKIIFHNSSGAASHDDLKK